MQSLLTWLSDKDKPVFVIATANDISKLPPELTRSGRFDEIFTVSLPSPQEREDIIKIHLRKRNYDVENQLLFTDSNFREMSAAMPDFTGAEIEQVISETGRRAYADYRKGARDTHTMTTEDIIKQAGLLVPLSKRNPEIIKELRDWTRTSAKCASSYEHAIIHGTSDTDAPKLFSLPKINLD